MTYTTAQRRAFETLGIPYVCLESEELMIYDAILAELKPQVCLEWGAGWSTVYFPSRHPYIEWWIAIEHDRGWYDRLKDRVPANVDLWYCPDKRNYVVHPSSLGVKFDFISIDGVHRGLCMSAASILLKRGTGRCLLHDTERVEYHQWFKSFDHTEKLISGLTAEQNPHGNAGRGLHMFWNK